MVSTVNVLQLDIKYDNYYIIFRAYVILMMIDASYGLSYGCTAKLYKMILGCYTGLGIGCS